MVPSTASATSLRGPARWYADRGLAVKLFMMLGVALAAALTVGITGTIAMGSLDERADRLNTESVIPLGHLAELEAAVVGEAGAFFNYALEEHPDDRQELLESLQAMRAQAANALRTYRSTSAIEGRADASRSLQVFSTAWTSYLDLRDQKLLSSATPDTAAEMHETYEAQARPLLDTALAALRQLEDLERSLSQSNAEASEDTYRKGRNLQLAVLGAGLLLALALAVFTSRFLLRAVARVSYVIDGFAQGDLTRRSGVDSRDEFGRMAVSLDRAAGSLQTTVAQVGEGAQRLSASTDDLHRISEQIAVHAQQGSLSATAASHSSQEVAQSVQSVATSAEEMSAAVNDIARDARAAAGEAAQAAQDSATAGAILSELASSSAQIGNVVKFITAVAAQTNLLALNATIEAARAGESGKGFGVVANEVKDLAQETAKATDDIAGQVRAIQTGTDNAGRVIDQITAVITRVNALQDSIASAIEQQRGTTGQMSQSIAVAAAGTEQIATGISTVAETAHETTMGLDRSNAAVADLAAMGAELRELVGQFTYAAVR